MANITAINIAIPNVMTGDNSTPLPSRLARLSGIAALLALAIFVVIVQLGQAALYGKQWDAALLFPTSKGEAASQIASQLLAAKETDQANILANKALDSSLTHVEALRTIGITKFAGGDKDNGKKLVLLAADLSWRDSPTQAWLFEQSLIQGDYQQSIQHADALLRRRKARNEIFNIFTLAATDPQLAETVRTQIANNPPWRSDFFADADKTIPEQYRGFDNIINGLAGTSSPVTRDELMPYANMLVKTGNVARALKTWTNIFPAESALVPADGSLPLQWPQGESSDRPSPTDWKFRNSRSFTTYVDGTIGEDGAILTLELDRRAIGRIAQRALIVPPGKVSIQMTNDTADIRDLRKLRWYFECNAANSGKQNEILLAPSTEDPLLWEGEIDQTCPVYNLVMAVKLGGLQAQGSVSLGAVTVRHSAQ